MKEQPNEKYFLSEEIDEQIARLQQKEVRGQAEIRLIHDLESVHREEHEVDQAVERIWQRLAMQVQSLDMHNIQVQRDAEEIAQHQGTGKERKILNILQETPKRSARLWSGLVAVLIAALIVGSLLMALHLEESNKASRSGSSASPNGQKTQQSSSAMYLGVGNRLVKVDVQTHKVIWRFSVVTDPHAPPEFSQVQIVQPPVVAGQSIYFTAQDGKVYAVNAQTGSLQWQRSFKQELGRIYVANDTLYINTYEDIPNGDTIDQVYALNLNGTTKMTYKAAGSIVGLSNGVLYLAHNISLLQAIRVTDGSVMWQTQFDSQQNVQSVYLKNGVLYTSSSHISQKQTNESQASYVYTLNAQSGKITWQSQTINGFIFDIAVGDDGRIYCGAQDHFVYAFDPQANKLVWRYRTSVGYVYPAPIVQNGVVYVGQDSAGQSWNWFGSGSDHLVALNAATGRQEWATPLAGYTGTGDDEPLVLNNGIIYLSVGTSGGELLGIAIDGGKPVVNIPVSTLLDSNDTFSGPIAITIMP